MSLAITLIKSIMQMRARKSRYDPPAPVDPYRDGEGDASVLTAAVRFDMINVRRLCDVLKQAVISFDKGRSDFDYQGSVRTVLAGNAAAVGTDCELGMRCLQLPGLYVVERSDEILETPAGAARAFNLSFPLVSWNCAGDDAACKRFGISPVGGALPAGLRRCRLRFTAMASGGYAADGRADLDYMRKVGGSASPAGKRRGG